MHVGKNVWKVFGDSGFRCGTIVEEQMCDGWKYVRVNWVDDHEYKMDRQRIIELRGRDCRSDWSRIDKVNVFDKETMISKINKL